MKGKVMTTEIRAIVVDPTKHTIEEVRLPTTPGDGGAGAQVGAEAFQRLIGCEFLEGTYLGKGISLMLNGEPVPEVESQPRDFWQYGSDCDPILGIGVISGHDMMRDHAYDCPISLEEARSRIRFTKRIIRGSKVRRERERGVDGRHTRTARGEAWGAKESSAKGALRE
jgi:hypothetical protein